MANKLFEGVTGPYDDDGYLDEEDLPPPREPTEVDLLKQALDRANFTIAGLSDENRYLRRMSSSGFARGTIRQAPTNNWPVVAEVEDFL